MECARSIVIGNWSSVAQETDLVGSALRHVQYKAQNYALALVCNMCFFFFFFLLFFFFFFFIILSAFVEVYSSCQCSPAVCLYMTFCSYYLG